MGTVPGRTTDQAEVLPVGPPVPITTGDEFLAPLQESVLVTLQVPHSAGTVPIFNLSSHALTSPEVSLLTKGLSYVLTERTDFFLLRLELQRFFRKLRLHMFFCGKEFTRTESASNLRNPSTFCPPIGTVPHEILSFEAAVLREITIMEKKSAYIPYNISLDERKALEDLKTDRSIVIKPADKGGGIVIQDFVEYHGEIMRQLDNSLHYKKIER